MFKKRLAIPCALPPRELRAKSLWKNKGAWAELRLGSLDLGGLNRCVSSRFVELHSPKPCFHSVDPPARVLAILELFPPHLPLELSERELCVRESKVRFIQVAPWDECLSVVRGPGRLEKVPSQIHLPHVFLCLGLHDAGYFAQTFPVPPDSASDHEREELL